MPRRVFLLLGLVAGALCKTALLVVDVQDCFLDKNTASGEPGSLAVNDAHVIIPLINKIRRDKSCLFDLVVRTQDYHPTAHVSFASTHGLPAFAHLNGKGELPLHCLKPNSSSTSDASCCASSTVNPAAVNCTTALCPTQAAASPAKPNPACTTCKVQTDRCFATTQAMWPDHCLQDADSGVCLQSARAMTMVCLLFISDNPSTAP